MKNNKIGDFAVRMMLKIAAAVVAGLGFCCYESLGGDNSNATRAADKPNIVFIILDDVGVDQMKLYGFGGVEPPLLPNIGMLAKNGVTFTNVWAMPECSPSRAAFFTGRYPIRTGVTSAIAGNHLPQEYMSQYEATLPRVLEKAGYVSAMIGKYHLGNEKDPAGSCAPATRGFTNFIGNMSPGPPSIDKTAGGADPTGHQVCGYVQNDDIGACYTIGNGTQNCTIITAANANPATSPARSCLQRGGLFRPNLACGVNAPTSQEFQLTNGYYVWPRTKANGPRSPDSTNDNCGVTTDRRYMTERQAIDAVQWWKSQSGPRMLTLSFNAIHTPFQKASTAVVPDPHDDPSSCSSLAPPRPLINNMLEGADVEIGRVLAGIGLAKLDAAQHRIVSLNLSDTLVVVVGDNGSYGSTVRVTEGFSAGRAKATVYQTGVWVPLIVAGAPVNSPGRKVDDLINVVDLYQLFGDVAGINVAEIVPPSHTLDSKPLLPYLHAASTKPIRETNFTQVASGKFTPNPSERSWPCLLGNTCNDTLLFNQALCEDNGGTWYGPGGTKQASSCCAVVAGNSSLAINPVTQYAVRNKRHKLVQLEQTNCKAPLPPNTPTKDKAFPWAEYQTKTVREFYDISKSDKNPIGIDNVDLLTSCKQGKNCLSREQRAIYAVLANELDATLASADVQTACLKIGDGNQDLRINQADVDGWRTFKNKGPSQYDINRDGKTDDKDLAIIKKHLGTNCLGLCARADLNRDGAIDGKDMTVLQTQMGKCDPVLCGGDLDGNGKVDEADVRLMTQAQSSCSIGRIKGAAR